MMNRIKKYFLCVLSLWLPYMVCAQDIHFSQNYNFPLYTNPANTGDIRGAMRAVMAYRSQWASVAIPYTTMGASIEGVLYKNKRKTKLLAVGLMALSDKVGDYKLQTDELAITLAAGIKTNRTSFLTAGLQTGFGQKKLNPSVLQWGNQYNGLYHDPTMASGEGHYFTRVFYRDVSAGLNWTYNQNSASEGIYSRSAKRPKSNLGVAMYHINRPNTTLNDPNMKERLYRKLTVNGSTMFGSKQADVWITPSFLFEWQGPSYKTNIGFMTRYLLKQGTRYTGFTDGKAFSLGAFYRYKDAAMVSMLYEYQQFALGISYDVNVSKFVVATTSRGGLEVTLRWCSPQEYRYNARGKHRGLRAKF